MEFKKYLLESAENIDIEVGFILEKWRNEAGNINKSLLTLIDAFIKCNKGGKGIRGALVRLGYEMTQSVILSETKDLKMKSRDSSPAKRDRNDKMEIIKVAAAYEILHTSILAHDDIMDQDIERRGQPSLYQALGGLHYGISQAISLADAGFFLATKIIAESDFDEKLKNQALSLFAKIMVDTSIGQMLDVNQESGIMNHESREEGMVQTINLLKTARYTISGPLKIGVTLAGAKFGQLAKLDQFGENLGIAYQIRDDILDSEVKSVVDAQKKVLEYTGQARSLIPKLTENMKYRKLLQDLTLYLVERRK